MSSRLITIFCYVVFIVAIVNFFIFYFNSISLGGDALNGKIENGQYYVGLHGRYTAVSQQEFEINKFHAYFLFISWPLAMVAATYLNRSDVRIAGNHVDLNNWINRKRRKK